MTSLIISAPAPNVPYFTPAQEHPAGSALDPQPDGKAIPKIFQPLKIRGLTFHNRIWLSPLCQYSSDNGKATPWHLAHLGGIFTRGPGLSCVEATAVLPEGRITPQDAGLWNDEQIEPLRQIIEFAHSQNQKMAIQLGHAGRKGSTVAPWLNSGHTAPVEDGGWPASVIGPSTIPYNDRFPVPQEATREQLKQLVIAFVLATKRALKAGFDVIDIHGGHGYILHQFLSPHSNHRTDEYGGSFENRVRLILEVVDAIRAVIPTTMPLFFRLSVTDWLEHLPEEPQWNLEDSKKLAELLAAHGVDVLDVTSAANSSKQKLRFASPVASQAPLSEVIRSHVHASLKTDSPIVVQGTGEPLLITAVGGISTGDVAEGVLTKGQADAVFVGRYFQQNPGLVWQFARELEVAVHIAHQMEWPFAGRGGRLRPREEKGGHDANVPISKDKDNKV